MSAEFPSNLNNFLSTPEVNEFYDTTIESKDGQKHNVAKIIVAVHSNVLYKMFSKEKNKNNFKLPTVPGEVLENIFSWMESGQLFLSWRNVYEVLQTAEFLDVPDVSCLCQEWMIARMNSRNALGIWMFARDNFLQGLEKTAMSFIGSNFTDIYQEKEFSDLHQDITKILLLSNKLSCGEEMVWEGLKVWLYNNEKDETEITTLVETIRFGLLEHNFFDVKVRPVLDILVPNFNSSWYFNCNTAEPRYPESLLFTFGGWSESVPLSTISVMDPAANKWTDLKMTLPSNFDTAYFETVMVDTDVFLWNTFMFMKFNLNTLEISNLSKMKDTRGLGTFATHNKKIYAIGGESRSGLGQRSVEMYDINRNQWYKIRSMNMIRVDAGAATLNGKVYVVGGLDENGIPTNTVEMFSPVSGKWSLIHPMKVARSKIKVVVMDSKLYVVGGFDGRRAVKNGEVYDPETREWTDLPNMNRRRYGHILAAVQGKIMVMGGCTGERWIYKVEQLSLLTNKWEQVEDLPWERSEMRSGVINFNNLNSKLKEEARTFRLEMSNGMDTSMDEDESFNESEDEIMIE